MKSTLLNMILSLFGITLVASAGVAVIYETTKEPIAAAQQAAVELSLTNVLPAFDESVKEVIVVDDFNIEIYTASMGGEVVGYAVQSATKQGYSGLITLMVGISPADEVLGVSILSHAETPGLGSKMCDEGNPLIESIGGKSLETTNLTVKKDGGDIDALTGATITSRAYGDAVARAYKALKLVKEKGESNE